MHELLVEDEPRKWSRPNQTRVRESRIIGRRVDSSIEEIRVVEFRRTEAVVPVRQAILLPDIRQSRARATAID